MSQPISARDAEIIATYQKLQNKSETARTLGLSRNIIRGVLTKYADELDPVTDPEGAVCPKKAAKRKTFVVTSVLNNCPIHKPFLAALETYCDLNDAQLIAIPVRYKNLSLYAGKYEVEWPSELDPYYLTRDVSLSSNLMILGSMRIQATAKRPLSGTHGISKGKSAIFGHPRVALETHATPTHKYPLVYMTTGSVSMPAYSDTKAGRIGEFHHTLAAVVIETDGDKFWWRHLHWGDGTITDLGMDYDANGAYEAPPAEALIPGDVHVGWGSEDSPVFSQLHRETSYRAIVLHDILDFFSASHHHDNQPALKYMKALYGRDDVDQELMDVVAFMEHNIPVDVHRHVIRSNHHDHLDRWLNSKKVPENPKNLELWYRLNARRLGLIRERAEAGLPVNDWRPPGALELVLAEYWDENTPWSIQDDREPLEIAGIDCSQHGDRGPNGSRGSRAGFAKVQRKTIIGHSHSPGIHDGCYQVGLSCRTDLPYNTGYSSWLNCSAIIYANGTRTLLPVIDGHYRRPTK